MHNSLLLKSAGRLLCAGVVFGLAGVAGAQTVTAGAGTGIANDENDSAGGRINVDTGTPVTLQPGTYQATNFRFDAGIAGDVTPFLATDNGNGTYTAIAVGTDQAAVIGQDQSVAFGGSDTFIIGAPTTVYAGIASDTQNPVALDNGTGPNTDHEGVGQGGYAVTVGGVVPPDGAFSNPDLGRTYAFAIDINLIPEPATAGLMAALGLGLCALRPRRR